MEPTFKTFQIICLKCGSEDVDLTVTSQLDDAIRLRCIRCRNVEDDAE